MKEQALEIVFDLVTPVHAPTQPIHLDGLLAWAKAQRALRAGEDPYAAAEDLPLAKCLTTDADRWCWKASQVRFQNLHGRFRMMLIRRADTWAMAVDHDAVHAGCPNVLSGLVGTGPYKAYKWTAPMLIAQQARAWCVGDPEAILDLLGDITHLGKLRRLDCGRIANVRVTPVTDPDDPRWQLRTLPGQPDALPGFQPAVCTLRAPYWDRAQMTDAWEPTAASWSAAEAVRVVA